MIKLKTLLSENILRNLIENTSINATLIWLKNDGTIYDTNDMQHGLYIAEHCGLFGVSNALVQKVFKNANTDENFDFDDASAVMCEQAFAKKWMRIVKVPWNNKIFVEGNEPTRAQKKVLEDWYFEDKSKSIIWQRWVSSKFGPPRPVILFHPENETNNELNEIYGFNEKYFFVGDCSGVLTNGCNLFSDLMDMSYQVEHSKPLDKIEFANKIMENSIPKQYRLFKMTLRKNPDAFKFGEGDGFVFAFDGDYHYFFTL